MTRKQTKADRRYNDTHPSVRITEETYQRLMEHTGWNVTIDQAMKKMLDYWEANHK